MARLAGTHGVLVRIGQAIVILVLIMGLWMAAIAPPFSDEAAFAAPAVSLATAGSFGSPVLDNPGSGLQGIGRHTYWILPVYPLLEVPFYLLGFRSSPFWGRLVSLAFSVAGVWAVWRVVGRLTRDPTIAALSVGLLVSNVSWLMNSAAGRPDMVCFSLGWLGLATAVAPPEWPLRATISAAHALGALACLTHPNGLLFPPLIALAQMALNPRGCWKSAGTIAAACAPYLILGTAYGTYVSQGLPDFIAQFGGNATGGGRLSGLSNPWDAIRRELAIRYGDFLHATGNSFVVRSVKLLTLSLYVASVALCAISKTLRTRYHGGWLCVALGLHCLFFTFVDGMKWGYYFIYLLVWYCIATALVLRSRLRPWGRFLGAAVCLFIIAFNGARGLKWLNSQAADSQAYWSTANLVGSNGLGTRSTIVGPAAFAFALGFEGFPFHTDDAYGWSTGHRPDAWIVEANRSGAIHPSNWFGACGAKLVEARDGSSRIDWSVVAAVQTRQCDYLRSLARDCSHVASRRGPTRWYVACLAPRTLSDPSGAY